jgi:hypothetical protein
LQPSNDRLFVKRSFENPYHRNVSKIIQESIQI